MCYVDDKAQNRHDVLTLNYTIEHDIVTNWDEQICRACTLDQNIVRSMIYDLGKKKVKALSNGLQRFPPYTDSLPALATSMALLELQGVLAHVAPLLASGRPLPRWPEDCRERHD